MSHRDYRLERAYVLAVQRYSANSHDMRINGLFVTTCSPVLNGPCYLFIFQRRRIYLIAVFDGLIIEEFKTIEVSV